MAGASTVTTGITSTTRKSLDRPNARAQSDFLASVIGGVPSTSYSPTNARSDISSGDTLGVALRRNGGGDPVSTRAQSGDPAVSLDSQFDSLITNLQQRFDSGSSSMLRGIAAAATGDGVTRSIKAFVDQLDADIKGIDLAIGDLYADQSRYQGLAAAAERRGDMAGAMRYLKTATRRAEQINLLIVESDKRAAIRRLLMLLLIGGYIPPELIAKLRGMGLGKLVDQLVSMLLKKSNLSRQLIQALKQSGLGWAVAGAEQRLDETEFVDKDTARKARIAHNDAASKISADAVREAARATISPSLALPIVNSRSGAQSVRMSA